MDLHTDHTGWRLREYGACRRAPSGSTRCAGLLAGAIVVSFLCSATLGADEPPRTRTLTFDAGRRAWVEQPPPPPGTPDGDLHIIRVQIRDGAHREALRGIRRFEKRHGRDTSLAPDLLLARADALVGRRKLHKAYETLQAFLGQWAGHGLTSEAYRLQFEIAEAYLSGAKRRVLGVPLLSGVDFAYRMLDDISTNDPGSRLAELAIKTKADHLFDSGDHALAELEYSRLLQEYPQSQYRRFAARRVAEAALANFRGVEYDEAALMEAQERYNDYIAQFPDWARQEGAHAVRDTLEENRAAKLLSVGRYYERTGHLSTAVFYYRTVLDDWPTSRAALEAQTRLQRLGGATDASSARTG